MAGVSNTNPSTLSFEFQPDGQQRFQCRENASRVPWPFETRKLAVSIDKLNSIPIQHAHTNCRLRHGISLENIGFSLSRAHTRYTSTHSCVEIRRQYCTCMYTRTCVRTVCSLLGVPLGLRQWRYRDTAVSGGCVRFHDLFAIRYGTLIISVVLVRTPARARFSHRSRRKFREDRAIVKTEDRHVCVCHVRCAPIN